MPLTYGFVYGVGCPDTAESMLALVDISKSYSRQAQLLHAHRADS